MPRVKRGVNAHKHREKTLKYTKGYQWGRKSKERAAKEALLHAWTHAFRGRKENKRNYRALWSVKINAAVRAATTEGGEPRSSGERKEGLNYSKLINALKKKKVLLDRKILADLAEHEPAVFKKIVAFVK
jgi:large subunit ribosomal protein L20